MRADVSLVNPETHNKLKQTGDILRDAIHGVPVAKIVKNIPRFVEPSENYAESFGWQWKKWSDNQSESRGSSVKQRELILDRTHFLEYDLDGKSILECGMGGGDDTEVLLSLPFGEIHSFDLSTAVERAQQNLSDERLFLAQASIYAIPYPDQSFDFVYCHRVLQHTPDPENSLRCICKKVKPGGILFVHSYKRSKKHMSEWRYKYRWITKRVPRNFVYWYVKFFGVSMHYIVDFLHKLGGRWANLAYSYFPFYRVEVSKAGHLGMMGKGEAIEFAKMITFDALTPKYDSPMATDKMKSILSEEGFTIDHLEDSYASPVFATARKTKT